MSELKPERRVILEIKIDGDSWEDVACELKELSYRIKTQGQITTLISGGYSSGVIVTGKENQEQTGDNYRKQNQEYVKTLRKTNEVRDE